MAAVHYPALLCVPECSGAAQVTGPGAGVAEEAGSSRYLPA